MSKAIQRSATVCLGEGGMVVGQLAYARSGMRENSSFAYSRQWLQSIERFSISPDLLLIETHQYHKAASANDSVFHFAIADTAPDGWGCRVIARDHAKRRNVQMLHGAEQPFAPLTEWDYLVGVDDFSRVGALRLRDETGNYLRTIESGDRATPPLLELAHLLGASHAVERGSDTEADLRYLRGRGTSLGGLRPKCSVIDDNGQLAIGKFSSVKDQRSVTKGEVLALRLALVAGIDAAQARIVYADKAPVAVVRRFDRTLQGGRIPYLSAASLLQLRRDDDSSYSEIAERIIATCADPKHDLAELWRRIVFNLLITNVDDHLHNHGFLHVGHGQWRLAPAFDLNPFPDKDQELKTWLTEDTGPVSSIKDVLLVAAQFWLERERALEILRQVYTAVENWRVVALTATVGMEPHDLVDFAPAFEHAQMKLAATLLRQG
ncbi:type II toxin-antitoxin system HipA family toxin [Pelodictyon phaeoclathratiforme]|jgi:serine/threonine-protein kinase HipA|uniref:HipA domain protein n=1 Tax=Pelodictyon phaeoclathratiforme (strain DSM 5477 / BU-1) TaxID=324925 RepID=B4SAC0_PELPB|nr:HipA domain-containing protein [Pelodictyon phaeoclathratiforme]ACF43806.1 HipA domain protein [Pelodictyon phaeoclathratiforme BU-1]MBV5289624.1 type II toxin-antitoxin system HipA family toxin [Pelodictyon phaeoclathratiforme]